VALVETTLSAGLANLVPTDDESDAIGEFVGAWESYFDGATVLGIPIVQGGYATALTAMKASLVGLSVGGAATKIQSSISAFWTALAPLAPTLWPMPPNTVSPGVVPPPGIGSIAGALASAFEANRSSSLDLQQSAANIAGVLAASGGAGATATIVPPPPASPFVAPIL
jgi:hypothetical protein